MEKFLIFLLYIPYILIRIGEILRFIIIGLKNIFIYISNGIIKIPHLIIRNIKKYLIQIHADNTKPKHPITLKTSKPVSISKHELINSLPKLYLDAIITAFRWFWPKHKNQNVNVKYKTYSTHQPKNKFKISDRLSNFLPKPTSKHPIILYPTALLLAWRIKWFFFGVTLTILFLVVPFVFYTWLSSLPNPLLLSQRDIEVATKIFDRNGILLYEVFSEQNRTPVPLSEIPLIVQEATIAIEDRSFYQHQGFSVKGTIRAARENLLHHKIQGGSTITQQLIKSALLTPEISLTRKIRELVLAFWAERLYTKKQILEMYLNQVPYGGTAWGIESASQTYFGKSVRDLTLAEAAYLAGLPVAPSTYSPYGTDPQSAILRQKDVLRRMTEDDYITKLEAEMASNEQLTFKPPQISIIAPHFVMYVKDILEKRYGTRAVERGGLRIKTSLDASVQKMAQEIVTSQVQELEKLRVGNGAAIVTDPKNGQILAMIGSRNYFDINNDGNVNVTMSLRQPGSSIKPLMYAAALENGFTAATPIEDTPVAYRIPGSPTYIPVNYDGRYHGVISLRSALANSYNIPAVKTLAKIGLNTMITKAQSMGISTWNDTTRFGLSLTLGGGEVTMLDMAEAYGTLANYGRHSDLIPILEISDYKGHIWETYDNTGQKQVVMPEVAYIITSILSDNDARTPAFGSRSSLYMENKNVAVKTGTTNEKRDNWTIGYTPSYVVVVWVGNNDNTPMDPVLTSGITGASTIWHNIMADLIKNKNETYTPPDNIVEIPCYNNKKEIFIKGTEPAGGRCSPIKTPTPTPN